MLFEIRDHVYSLMGIKYTLFVSLPSRRYKRTGFDGGHTYMDGSPEYSGTLS